MGMHMGFPFPPRGPMKQAHNPHGAIATSKIPAMPKTKVLRRGKWTMGEEKYAEVIIDSFKLGVLEGVDDGTTLRSLLASKLKCAPMRISKKYSGSSIGKVRPPRMRSSDAAINDHHLNANVQKISDSRT
jgi:hypothetical protein